MQNQNENQLGIVFRNLSGPWKRTRDFLLAIVSLLALANVVRLPSMFGIQYYEQQLLALFIGGLLIVTFISVAPHQQASTEKVPWYDVLLIGLSAIFAGYLFSFYPSFTVALTSMSTDKLIFASLAVILILEAVRRLFGWVMMLIPVLFIAYMLFANVMPPILQGRAMPWDRGFIYLFLDPNGMLGIVLRMIATIVLVFIVFGHALIQLGAGKALTDFAFALMGRRRGGAAKASILMSSMFGSISGSPVANVTVTGTFTIPLMKRTGYPLVTAASVESVASTGGLIMPPVLGTTAFIMAEFLGMPYSQVVLAAILPALLFYITLFVQVDIESVRLRLSSVPVAELPKLADTWKPMWLFLIPMGALIFFMFGMDMRPARAGLYAIGIIVLMSWLIPGRRFGWRAIYEILVKSGHSVLQIGVIGAAVGFIMGSVNITGLSVNLSRILLELGGSSLLLLLAMTAITSIILGMGMPSTPVYVTLAVLVAPALITAGITPIAAHMFLFYYGILSFVTPPVAIASYTAAAVAGTNAIAVGWKGMRMGGMLYVLPWLFVYVPELLILNSDPLIVATIIGVCMAATLSACFALGGWMFGKLTKLERIVLGSSSLLFWISTILLSPSGPLAQATGYQPQTATTLSIIGTVLWIGIILLKLSRKREAKLT